MRVFSAKALLLVTLLSTSCSYDENSSDLKTEENDAKPNPIVITMGGFDSCAVSNGKSTPVGTERWQKGQRLTNMFARETTKWFGSCFDKWGNIFFVSSFAPNTVQRATINHLENYVSAIAALTEQGKDPVFIIGHSHGGWLALATAYALPSWVKIESLTSVDPISPHYCTPANYIALIISPITAGSSLAGCRQAPPDIDQSVRNTLLSKISDRSWRHYYQRNFLPLASSQFPGGPLPHFTQDLSPFLSNFPAGARPSFNAHIEIDRLSIVWYSFEVSIGNKLQ